MDLILNIDSIEHTSYKNKAKLLQKQWKLKIHRSTVYLHKKNKYSQYSQAKWKGILNLLNKTKLECSRVHCYDEEFIGNKNQKYTRLSLMDANTRVIINDLKIPNEEFTSDFVKISIKYSLKDLSVYSDPHNTQSQTSIIIT